MLDFECEYTELSVMLVDENEGRFSVMSGIAKLIHCGFVRILLGTELNQMFEMPDIRLLKICHHINLQKFIISFSFERYCLRLF